MKNMTNILIEIGVEEMPYKNMHKISTDIKKLTSNNFKKKNIKICKIKSFITIRRLALLIETKNFDELKLKENIKNIIDRTLEDIKFKTKMRWGINAKAFIRPIKWYVLLLNTKIINHTIFGIKSQNTTLGHKSTPTKIKITPCAYEHILKTKGYVICDYLKRKHMILNLIKKVIKKKSLNLILKKDSINNITNIVEYPSIIICNFKKIFLKLPEKITTISLLKNHFCFLLKKENKLTNKIIIIADTYRKKTNIKNGYTYIINTKLSELQYLYEKEQNYLNNKKTTDLKKLIINEKLGNMYDKTLRITNIVKFIKSKLKIKSNCIITASKLIKMDLLTKIVTEMPELIGLICSYNIENAPRIKNCIYEYNQIVNNKIKKHLYGAIIALADKIDNIVSYFIINKQPSGSKDPFNLRKDAKIIIKLVLVNKININLFDLLEHAIKQHTCISKTKANTILNFIISRQNYKNEIFKIIKNKKNLFKLNLKIEATENFLKYDFKNLLLKNIKRISKITEKNKISLKIKLQSKLLVKREEKILINKIKYQIKTKNILIKHNRFFECTKTLINIEKTVKIFFESIFILDENKNIMTNRLKLLNIIKYIMSSEINLAQLISN